MKQETLIEAAKRVAYPNGEERNGVSEIIYRVFKEGAEWQRNHVWRKNTEMPSDGVNKDGIGKSCMVQEGSRVFLCHACRTTIGKYYFVDHSHHYHPIENVDGWAYLDNLMPTSFDNNSNN